MTRTWTVSLTTPVDRAALQMACACLAVLVADAMAQAPRDAARIALDTTPAALCTLLDKAPQAQGLGRVFRTGGAGQPNYFAGDGTLLAAHGLSCNFEDRKNLMKSISLHVITSADARTHAQVVRDTGMDVRDYPPVERLRIPGGECAVSQGDTADPNRPMAQVTRWEAVCSAAKGLKVVQLLASHSDRAALPRLTELRAFFDGVMKKQ